MFEIEGRISNLYVTDGTQNLLEGMRAKMAATGLGAVVNDMAGSVAAASMVAMYDGEGVQHFSCYVGEAMVIGTFETVDFKDGEDVFIVASRLDDNAVFAHAVVRASDGWLWMPRAIAKGRWRVAHWIAVACLLFLLFSLLLFGLFEIISASKEGIFGVVEELALPFVVLSAVIGFGVYRSSLPDARYAESIFKVLGFRNPKSVNLSPYSQARLHGGVSYMTYDFAKALEAFGIASSESDEPKQTGD